MKRTPNHGGFEIERRLPRKRREAASGQANGIELGQEVGGRVPRLARLLALAHKMQGLVDRGEVADYSDLARLGGVTTARITQIMNLLRLAPDLQERILLEGEVGRETGERHVLRLARHSSWVKQRKLFERP